MFCNKCGAQLQDTATFCSFCGAAQTKPENQAPVQQPVQQSVAPVQQPVYQQPVYQQPAYQQPAYQQPAYQQPAYQQPVYSQPGYNPGTYQRPLPMNWFKFLIYVALFLTALSCLSTAISYLTGTAYDSFTNSAIIADALDYELNIYTYIPDLESADITYGVLNILLAVFAIVVRFRLSGYHKDGPKLLLALYGASTGVSLLYCIWATSAIKESIPYEAIDYFADELATVFSAMMTATAVMSVVICGIMTAANAVYFKKRAHLFH